MDAKNAIEMDRNEIQVESIALKEEIRTLRDKLKAAEVGFYSSFLSFPFAFFFFLIASPSNHQVQVSVKEQVPPAQRKLSRQPTSTALQVSITEELVFNEGESMKDLSKGMQELVAASDESNPTKILTAMKSVVMTVRRHLDDAEEYEKSKGATLAPEQREKFNNLQNDISDKLTALVMVAKGMMNTLLPRLPTTFLCYSMFLFLFLKPTRAGKLTDRTRRWWAGLKASAITSQTW